MSSEDALAYFLEEDQVRGALPGWPAEMSLVLCMTADGRCEMVVCHREEGRRALRKAAAVIGRPEGGFAVAPRIEGYPTRTVRFSDEQEMLKLVAAADQLTEMAVDYAINYRFAKEEGLDPDAMVSGRRRPAEARTSVTAPTNVMREIGRRLHLGLASEDRGARRKAEKPAAPGMPAGFAPCAESARKHCHFVAGHIANEGNFIRVTLLPEKVTIQTEPVRVSEVGFSPDFARFFVPRVALSGWKPGRPAIIDIAVESFPKTLQRVFRARRYSVEITVTEEGVFLAPGAPLSSQTASRRKRRFTPLRAAMVGVMAAGLAVGTMAGAIGPSAEPNIVVAMLQALGPAGQ